MKKYKFKAPNRTFQFLLPFLCAVDNFGIVLLLSRLYLAVLGGVVQYSSIYWAKDMLFELVPYGDFNYNVVLQLRDGKKYIFSVQDAEDCCAEIMAKVEQYANK